MTTVEFEDEAGIRAAIKDVRDDATPTNWCLTGHADGSLTKIRLLGSGSGGVSELQALLDENNYCYGIVRVTDRVDMSDTVKFGLIVYEGAGVSFVKKGRMGIIGGSVRQFFQPYHVDFTIASPNEISDDIVKQKVQTYSGTASKVVSADTAAASQQRGFTSRSAPTSSAGAGAGAGAASSSSPAPKATSTTVTRVATSKAVTTSAELQFSDDLASALASVRSGTNNWVLGTYSDDSLKSVGLAGQGTGGIDELKSLLTDDGIFYGMLRVIDVIDGHETVKFVYIAWVGEDVKPMKKARLSTHKGALAGFFGHSHVTVDCGSQSEITEAIVTRKVQDASGSGSRVQ